MRTSLFLLCISIQVWAISSKPQLPKTYLQLPLVRQETNYSCGPASLLSILKFWDLFQGGETGLYQLLKTSEKDGTHPKNMVAGAKKLGLEGEFRVGVKIEELRKAVSNNQTVILDIQAWGEDNTPWKDQWENGHYISLIGLDEEYLYAMDPSVDDTYGYIPLKELYERWHDYENEGSGIWRNYQLAIFLKGKKAHAAPAPSKPLVRID